MMKLAGFIAGSVFLIFQNVGLMAVENDPLVLKRENHLSGEIYLSGLPSVGSQFFYEEWLEGDVLLRSGETVENQMLRYNGFVDELIWLPATDRQQVKTDKDLITRFTLTLPGTTKEVVFENITIMSRAQASGINIFAQNLHKGEISLYAFRQVKQKGEVSRRTERGVYIIPIMKAEPIYYIVLSDYQAVPLRKLNNRSLIRVFPEQRREIREILKDENLRIRSVQDMIHAVTAINQLIE